MNFTMVLEKVCDWILEGAGIHIESIDEAKEFPRREDRPPYPRDENPEVLPPLKPKDSATRRAEMDREFWESQE